MFSCIPDMLGDQPSWPAQKAAALFRKENVTNILELGAGQGRDTLFLAQAGFQVSALDYSSAGLEAVAAGARRLDLSRVVNTVPHDVRLALPFPDGSFDACYSHMLFCMALTTPQLESLSGEIRRVLRPGGLCVYTVRHKGDPHFGMGVHRGEDLYEHNGFIVHFFDKEQVHRLAAGWQVLAIEEFDEGSLPRRLFCVALRKRANIVKSEP